MSDNLQKGGKGAAVGTRKEFGGREYIKTADGWKFVGKGKGKGAQKHIDAHKTSTDDKQPKSTHSPEELSTHASNTSTEALTAVAHDKTKPKELQQAAQQELSHRDKGSKEIEPEKTEKKEEPKKEEKKEEKPKPAEKKEDKKDAHEKRGFDESKGDEDVTGKGEKIPADYGLPNEESAVEGKILAQKDGADKLSVKDEGFSLDQQEALTSESDSNEEDDINHKFEAFGRFAAGVIKGRMKSLIAYGSGGVGKTYTVTTELEKAGKKIFDPEIHDPGESGYDYVKITGKALSLDADIITPNGIVKNKDLSVGMEVSTFDGSSAKINQIFDQEDEQLYEVLFNDGSSVECTLNHLWQVRDRISRNNKVVDLKYILNKNVVKRYPNYNLFRFAIPLTAPVEYNNPSIVEIHPYLLGYLIGDGNICESAGSMNIAIGVEDQEYVLNKISSLLPLNHKLVPISTTENWDKISFRIQGDKNLNINLIRRAIISLDLQKTCYNKSIPEICFTMCVEDRIHLLQGLFDSDGTVEKTGSAQFCSVSKQLAIDVRKLAKSLGAWSSFKERVVPSSNTLRYEVVVNLPKTIKCCSLPRKAIRLDNRSKDIPELTIVAVNLTRIAPSRCISIDSDDHLYLTNDFIVTHNCTAAAVYQTMYEHNGKILLFDDCDSVLQDENAINLFKGALDTSGDGSINWGSAKKLKDSNGEEMPGKFAFNGSAMFVSNLDIGKDKNGKQSNPQLQPIVSRGYGINLTMDKKKTMDRITHIATSKDGKLTNLKFPGTPDYTHEDMKAVLEYMGKNKDKASDLNVRTVGTLLAIKKDADEAGVNWQDDAKYVYLRKSNTPDIYNGGLFNARKDVIQKSLGIDERTIGDKKIDWCTLKKASLRGNVKSLEYR